MSALSPATFYRLRHAEPDTGEATTELRAQIHAVALRWRAYGYRRITAELRRRDHVANHKRVLRLMRRDNLLRQRRFVATTDSGHGLAVYPNLTATLDVTGLDQLWVADLTYIRLRHEFVYLAVVLDAHSRRVLGWNLGRRLEAELAVGALRQALAGRRVPSALVPHSDRGSSTPAVSTPGCSTLTACGSR